MEDWEWKPKSSKKEREQEHFLQRGVVGVIERVNGIEEGQEFRQKRMVVGYFQGMRREDGSFRTLFSEIHPLYIFDVGTGEIFDNDSEIAKDADGYIVYFSGKPGAAFHQSWESDDPENPDKAFEPHARKVIGHRIIEMAREGRPRKEVGVYKRNANRFMEMAEMLFESRGQALGYFRDNKGITIRYGDARRS